MLKGFVSIQATCLWNYGKRGLATTVDKALLSKLRKRTGISFINCKKALEQFENDLEKAEKWLKDQAQKEGWDKATKLQSRPMSSGLIAIVANNQAATMIEVNCETDFVARNKKFIKLTTDLVQDCHKSLLPHSTSLMYMDKLMCRTLMSHDGKLLADRVALEVGNIGENIALRRAVHIKAGQSILSAYVHASGPEIMTNSSCRLGKYGVIVSLNQRVAQEEVTTPLDEIGHSLGQHIVGMSPKMIGSLEESDSESDTAESKDEDDNKEKEEKEEERLLYQEFLLDPSLSVKDLLMENGVEVNSFYRFACGEELPSDKKDS